MSFTINMDLLNKAREDNGMTVAPIGEQINYIAPDPIEDEELDILADTTADNTVGTIVPSFGGFELPGLDDTATTGAIEPIGSGFGAFGMDIDYDPDTYVSTDIVDEDTRPDFIKNSATSWEDREKQLNWYLENDYDPDTGYKLSQAVKDRLRFELEDGQGLWQAMQSDDPQIAIAAKNAMVQGGIDYGKSDAIKYGVPIAAIAGDIASGGMLSAAKNVTTGAAEGNLGKIAEGVLSAGLTLTSKDIKTVTEAAEAAAVAGDWTTAAELSREAEQLSDIKSGISTVNALASGNVGTALLSGAPLIGVDPVGSVTEMVFGVDSTFDDDFAFENNYKFGGGFDVSAASEGIVSGLGSLLDSGGDIEEAAKDALVTYAREGGSLPDLDLGGGAMFDIDLPDIDIPLPDIDLPDIDIPRINLGDVYDDIDFPDLPEINVPDINLPEINVPDINLPNINVPDINVPDINLPEINVPDINVPDFDVDLNAPEFNMELPEFNSPEFESFEADIELPELPSLKFTEGEKKKLEALPPAMKLQVASIMTNATFLQMSPLQQRDYLSELLRSMQA